MLHNELQKEISDLSSLLDDFTAAIYSKAQNKIIEGYCTLLVENGKLLDNWRTVLDSEKENMKVQCISQQYDSTKKSNSLDRLSDSIKAKTREEKGRWTILAYCNLLNSATGMLSRSDSVSGLLKNITEELEVCLTKLNLLRENMDHLLKTRSVMKVPSAVSTRAHEKNVMKPIHDPIDDAFYEQLKTVTCRS